MNESKLNLTELLSYINPSMCSYQEWTNVGMALKHEGYTAADWDTWSRNDSRYKAGECFQKWTTFRGTSVPVTGATITQMAKENGWLPTSREDRELDWNDEIGRDYVVLDKAWVEAKEIQEPKDWDPVRELTTYLETLFDTSDNVSYVTTVYENANGELKPSKGNWDRTAGQLIDALGKCGGDIGKVLGDYKEEVGAWIRFNPVDGKGVKNENVTEFRYALVESDSMDLEKQHALMMELELPIAALVHSGKKSIHAIVRVDAGSYEEYRKRVDYLYNVCKKNGLVIDTQNKNPSRLSRMPGVIRKGKKQFLIATNIGKQTWNEWHEWIEAINDDLPDPESLSDYFNNLPPLSPPLIHNVMRQGHKMLLAGPSKAGKSYALIELCIAVAEGQQWLGWQCEQGRILYVNLELDRASCLHRFKDVYQGLGLSPNNIDNIDIWNLRGKSVPMDKLAPKLIRRAAKKEYIAVVIDPIYKVITGDENSADQMAHFANQFDKICTELGTAVIYCHHHSKGAQGGKKAMDRASGSGVFARDPDALLDLTELELTDAFKKQEENEVIAAVSVEIIKKHNLAYFQQHVNQDDELSASKMTQHIDSALQKHQTQEWTDTINQRLTALKQRTAWRVDGTLREFPKFNPVNFWFDYPVHKIDRDGALQDMKPEGETPPWQKAIEKRKPAEKKKTDRITEFDIAFEGLNTGEPVTISDLAEELGTTKRTVYNRIKEHGGFIVEKNEGKESIVYRKDPGKN
jgi:hypothetical protein